MKIKFNRNPIEFGDKIEPPSQELIKSSVGLFRASMEDAIKFGGDLTRECLQKIKLKNKRKYVLVDVKTHMLMPGLFPALPGWHVDGTPRHSKSEPDILEQEKNPDTIYHFLVTGEGCLTDFLIGETELEIPDKPSPKLFNMIDEQVNKLSNLENLSLASPSCQVLTWDWWTIHRGVEAKKHEWRYLIRVCENDYIAPLTNLRDVLKTQQQVYAPLNFGW
jgi:hypothetical protein